MPVELGYDALNDKMEVKLKSEPPDENDENVENECKEECDPLGVKGECIFMDVGECDPLTGISFLKESTNFLGINVLEPKEGHSVLCYLYLSLHYVSYIGSFLH